MLKRFKSLEQQLLLEHQRHRDRVEDELYKMRQHLATALQDQQQQQQIAVATVREMFEHLRQELANTLHYISQDVAQTLRQAEQRTQRALDSLRDDVQYLRREHDQGAVRAPMSTTPLPTPGKPALPLHEEPHP
jgi:hypothetical protein